MRRIGNHENNDITLDIDRGCSWLRHNSDKIQMNEGLYNFLTTLFSEVAWPPKDYRRQIGPIAGMAYFSYEPARASRRDNFLLRRCFPPTVPLVELSQTRFDWRTRKALISQWKPMRRSAATFWLRGCQFGMSGTKCRYVVLIPVRTTKSFLGTLLIFERRSEEYGFERLARTLADFLCKYLRKMRTRRRNSCD
jgi:hypothetical protein